MKFEAPMNKFLCFLSVFLFGNLCHANISIDWNGYTALVTQSDTSPVPTGSLAQLIWAGPGPAGTPGALDPVTPLVPTGDDALLDTFTFTTPGVLTPLIYNYLAGTTYDDTMVYVRVFNSSTPMIGSEWADSGTYDSGDINGGGPSTPVDITLGGFQLTNVIVPEPSSFALFFFAAALMVNPWRFRRS